MTANLLLAYIAINQIWWANHRVVTLVAVKQTVVYFGITGQMR